MSLTTQEVINALNLAQCEIRAMYSRLGYNGSNALTEIELVWKAMQEGYTVTPKETGTGPQKQEISKIVFEVGKWYANNDTILRISRIAENKTEVNPMGLEYYFDNCSEPKWDGEWFQMWSQQYKTLKPATVEQIREHLCDLVDNKYKKNDVVKCLNTGRTEKLQFGDETYHELTDSFWAQSSETGIRTCLYQAGVWAEIIPHKPASVWELVEEKTRKECEPWLKSGKMPRYVAFDVLLQAVEKWNGGKEWEEDEEGYIAYYFAYWDEKEKDLIYEYEYNKKSTAFVFHSQEATRAFFALEDATELLKLVLNVK